MSKGNTDPEFTHVQTAACYADADHGLKPSNVVFFTTLAAPESLENFWVVQTSCWSISKKAGAVVSCCPQRVLPWCCVQSCSCCHCCWHLSPPWPAGINDPGVLWAWCLWLGTAALWSTTAIQVLCPFPLFLTLVERALSSAWESTSVHSALTGYGERTLMHEVDAYGFISAFLG